MAELYVDMEGLFEAVGEFDQEIKMCDQCIQALEECGRAIQRLADSAQCAHNRKRTGYGNLCTDR